MRPADDRADDVVHVLGCKSVQYGTFEDNLVELARACAERGLRSVYVYPEPVATPAFAEDVAEAGGKVLVVPGSGSGDLSCVRAVAEVVGRLHPSVVHGHFGRPGVLALLTARARGVRRLYHTQHHESWPRLTASHTAALRAAAAVAERIVCVSETVRAEALAAGIAPHKLAVLPFGVDDAKYAPDPVARWTVRQELGLDAQAPFVLCVSHLREPKGVDVLLDAWAGISARFPSAVLVLAGDGPLRGEFERRASLLPPGSVRFLGIRVDVPRLLAACDVFVCPSLSEAGGLNVIEALAAGAPVVSTRVGVLADGVAEDAFLAVDQIGESGPLAHAVGCMLAEPALAAHFAERGRAAAARSFPIRPAVGAIADLYALTAQPSLEVTA